MTNQANAKTPTPKQSIRAASEQMVDRVLPGFFEAREKLITINENLVTLIGEQVVENENLRRKCAELQRQLDERKAR